MEDSTTSGRDPAVDSTLADGLACYTCMGIDVLQQQKHMQPLGYYGLAESIMTWHHIYGKEQLKEKKEI